MLKISKLKPYYAASFFALVISISPVLALVHPSLSSALQIFLFLIILIIAYKFKLVKKSHFLVLLLIVSFIFLQNIISKTNFSQVQLSIFRFVIIPYTILYSFLLSKFYNKSFLNTFYLYFLINLLILYYRAFFDFTFFNTIYFDINEKYSDLYSIGRELWRPSNLSSAIVFSIELVLFISIQLFVGKKNKIFKFFILSSIIPLLLMFSRSSWFIISLCLIYYFFKNKKYFVITFSSTIILYLGSYFSTTSAFIDLITFKESSYASRFSSYSESFNYFVNDSVNKIFFGNGAGYSNLDITNSGSFAMYVENFHLSVLYDYGVFIFLLWIFFNLYSIYLFKKIKTKIFFLTLSLLMITNFFSSSLSSFPVQIFYQIILLYGYGHFFNFKTKKNTNYVHKT